MFELPKWILMNKRPSTLDTENLTIIEQTARVYGAMQELIKEYNTFSGNLEKEFNNLTDEQKEFKNCVLSLFNDFTKCFNDKFEMVKSYMIDDIDNTIVGLVSENKITLNLVHNTETEELTLEVITNE